MGQFNWHFVTMFLPIQLAIFPLNHVVNDLVESVASGTRLLLRGMLDPPDAFTTEGYDMAFGASVLGQLVDVVPHP